MFKTHRTYSLTTGVKGPTLAVVSDGSRVDVVYHKTLVLSKRGKTITLRNGGWDTISTRAVINRGLHEMLGTYATYLERVKGETVLHQNTNQGCITKPFVSGMRIKVAQHA